MTIKQEPYICSILDKCCMYIGSCNNAHVSFKSAVLKCLRLISSLHFHMLRELGHCYLDLTLICMLLCSYTYAY